MNKKNYHPENKINQNKNVIILQIPENYLTSKKPTNVPSEPIKRCLRSVPVLSFRSVVMLSRIVPSAKTAVRPTQLACRELWRMNLIPPAFVARFPPIKQEPFAPRSRGTS